ncbi:MAG TPA: hypothetical protein EYQ14_14980 [Gammaproteobacteria bacterium]|nr:hypothetical protein [Gammaproteobacteria bacterium]HIL98202.1 hypothetical protein [Pseudomonadales bacterium]
MDCGLQNVLLTLVFIAVGFVMYQVVKATRRKRHNSRLWGGIFESLSHHVQPIGVLKEAKQYTNRVKKLPDGDDKSADTTN